VPQANAAFEAAVLAYIDKQLATQTPPETYQTLQRLIGLGYTPEGARQLIARAVVGEIVGLMTSGAPVDHARYIAALHRLPQLPPEAQ
jgi:hypothetical protein